MTFGDWLVRLLPGLLSAAFFVVAVDWLQTRGLNARRRPRDADERVTDEIPAPATRVYLAAPEACADLDWVVYATDDMHFTLWAINRAPHPGLRNLGLKLGNRLALLQPTSTARTLRRQRYFHYFVDSLRDWPTTATPVLRAAFASWFLRMGLGSCREKGAAWRLLVRRASSNIRRSRSISAFSS